MIQNGLEIMKIPIHQLIKKHIENVISTCGPPEHIARVCSKTNQGPKNIPEMKNEICPNEKKKDQVQEDTEKLDWTNIINTPNNSAIHCNKQKISHTKPQ